MRDRNTDDITKIKWGAPDEEPPVFTHGDEQPLSSEVLIEDEASRPRAEERPSPDKTVAFHYPQPTPLREVLQAVAKWSDLNFVMDPSLNNRPVQIFAPRKLLKEDAFQLFVASLETIGLRALHLQGKVVKIVPMSLSKIAV